jgi:hypothetical protein
LCVNVKRQKKAKKNLLGFGRLGGDMVESGVGTMSEDQDHDAFLERFLPVQTALRGYLLAVTRDPAATDDAFQEVASVLWRKFGEFDRTRNFAAWAMGITELQLEP